MARARVLTEGPVRGSLIYLALPLLIGNILQQLYNTADAVIIGRWVNSAAFGAVGVAGTVMNLFIFVLSGACSGITVLFSQAYGAGDLGTFRRELYQSTLFGALFTLALGALATALLRPLLLGIQTPAELIGYASEYLRIIFAGFLATYAYNLCASALRSAGDTAASLCFLAVSIAANVGLDLLFVAVFGLGGVGSYAAEILARSGVGELTLVDQDTLSLTNINRQLYALSSTVGEYKAEAAARRCRDINPDIRVHPLCATYDAAHREDFFAGKFDYIADCIDLVTCKLDLIQQAGERGIPIISALGTGNKLDPTLLQVTDISKTSVCPLARVMRRELRDRGIRHLQVVYSPEPAAETRQLEAPSPGRRSVPASVPWVPSTAGILMASAIVRSLIANEEE